SRCRIVFTSTGANSVTRLGGASPRRMRPAWRMLVTSSSKSFFFIRIVQQLFQHAREHRRFDEPHAELYAIGGYATSPVPRPSRQPRLRTGPRADPVALQPPQA